METSNDDAAARGPLNSPAAQLASLYRGTFLFGTACGLSLALTPLWLDRAGFGKQEMGSLALFFAGGLVLCSLPLGAVLRRFGSKGVLTSALGGYALSVAAFPFMASYGSIAAIRFLDGAFSICIWVSSETVLLRKADERHKAHLTSLYAIWLASGYVAGPLVARVLSPFFRYEQLFLLAGAIALSAMVYLQRKLDIEGGSLGRTHADAEDEQKAPSTRELLAKIKTSCFSIFTYGYFQSAVVLFLPLYLMEEKGIPKDDTLVLPGLFCLGMLLASNLVGRIADKVGHLGVMTALSMVGMSCVMGFVLVDSYLLMCGLVFLAGATLAAMSPVALALVGVVTERRDLGKANGLYNTFYASGILLGPPISSWFFAAFGGAAMLLQLAALWAVFIGFSLVFAKDDPALRRRLALRASMVEQ